MGKFNDKDKTKVITIVGTGALGSHVLLFGRNLKVTWVAIDDDRVEKKNTLSQFHTRQGIGRNKAQAAAQMMKGLFGVNIKAVPHRLTADNAEMLLGGTDLILDCLDNGASRRILQALVRKVGTPCLHGALAADGQFGSVVWDEGFTIDNEDVEGQATCEGGEFLPFIVDVANGLVIAIQTYLETGKKVGAMMNPDAKTGFTHKMML